MPETEVAVRSKEEFALAELDWLRAAGARFDIVLTDAGCGVSAV